MAFAAVQTARGEFALTPGRDVSIIGFDNVAIAAWSAFDLTTYAQPIAAMVERIVDYLVRAMDGRAADEGLAAVKGDLIVRGSTRPAPGIVTDANGRRIWRRPPT
jgi:DNA-binding LacI/PurR family transcriptional regulator